MDEASLRESIQMYTSQLDQVNAAISCGSDNSDLLTLKQDLQQLLDLTEESLLNLKKSQLLASLESGENSQSASTHLNSTTNGPPVGSTSQDTSMIPSTTLEASSSIEPTPDDELSSDSDSESSDNQEWDQLFTDIVGTKCRAPFSHEWGEKRYHSAMILSPENIEEEPSVRVVFCQPTHPSMVPCRYFLNGNCRFSDNCRFSHGHSVLVSQLKEYIEPDHSVLALESWCLAQDADGVWYPAVVVETTNEEHQLQVMFDANHETRTVGLEQVVPSELEGGVSDKEETGSQPLSDSDDDEEDTLPVFLWRPNNTTDALGQWEAHTKGIGSKLMKKMGYITGQGLGRSGEGRSEPVPIQLLPAGKSLDKIMELKEIAGDRDLYDVMKKKERKHQAITQKKSVTGNNEAGQTKNVFDFINKKLHKRKGDHHRTTRSSQNKVITTKDLKSKSDRHINIQILKTSEEIKKTEQEITKLKTSLSRSQSSRDKSMVAHYEKKIAATEQYLSQLRNSQRHMEHHSTTRREHRKLTVF